MYMLKMMMILKTKKKLDVRSRLFSFECSPDIFTAFVTFFRFHT